MRATSSDALEGNATSNLSGCLYMVAGSAIAARATPIVAEAHQLAIRAQGTGMAVAA